MTEEQDPKTTVVKRATAGSGKLDYMPPVTIRDNRETAIEVTRWLIPHAHHDEELKVRIGVQKKKTFKVGFPVEFTLDESEALALRTAIDEGLALRGKGAPGTYVVAQLEGLEGDLAERPGEVVPRLIGILSRPEIARSLKAEDFGDALLNALRTSSHLQDLRNALEELRGHLDANDFGESIYQDWCARHSWAFGSTHRAPQDVRAIGPRDDVDFLIVSTLSGLRDVLELKTPEPEVLIWDKAHRNHYFSADVSRAIGQCHRYLDVALDAGRDGLRDFKDARVYHPRAIIIIGRSIDWDRAKLEDLHGLNERLHGIVVMTFDQLLAQGERMLEILQAEDRDGD